MTKPQISTLNNIQVVLCNTSHPGNIGAAARAMKTMGLSRLTLVAPIASPDDHALALACNAKEVVTNALITPSLEQAIANSQLVIAMTGRKREFNDRLQTPKTIVPELLTAINHGAEVSIVFGNEQNGLTIEQLELANRLVTIPGNPEYCSLNLAQAVQIMSYEIYSTFNSDLSFLQTKVERGTSQDIQYLMAGFAAIFDDTHFYTRKNPTRTLRRLQHILHKADLEREEVDLLHGIIKQFRNLSQGKQ